MQKKFFVSLFVPALLLAGSAGAQTTAADTSIGNTLGIRQAVDLAIKNNLLVNQADITAQTTRVNLNQSYSNMLPYINASASQGIGFGRSLVTSSYTYTDQQTASGSYSLNASLTLFSGLYYQNTVRQYKYLYNANQLDLQQQKENITLSVLLAYLQVLSAQDLLNIAKEQAEIDARQVERLDQQNKEGGLLLLSNLTDLRGQYAGDQASIATAANNLETAKINLFNYMNVPYKRDVQFDANALTVQVEDDHESPDSIYLTALKTLPMVRSADLKIKSYERALAAARGNYYPTLSFYTNVTSYYSNAADPIILSTSSSYQPTKNYVDIGGTQSFVYSEQTSAVTRTATWSDQFKNNRQTSLGLSLNIPILNYLRARNGVKQAKVNLKNTEISARSTKLVVQQNVESAYQNMIAAYKQYKAYIDQAAAYAESFRTTEIRFNEGVVNSDVYLIAKNRTDAANISLAQAKYTYIFRSKVMDYYQNRLTIN